MKPPKHLPTAPDREVKITILQNSDSISLRCHIGTRSIIDSQLFGYGRESVARSIIDEFLNDEHTPEGL